MVRFSGKIAQIVSQIFANFSQILIMSTLERVDHRKRGLTYKGGLQNGAQLCYGDVHILNEDRDCGMHKTISRCEEGW